MRIQYMMLCEQVQPGLHGLYNALGVLDRIWAQRLPASHPALAILALVIAEGDDDLGEHDAQVSATLPSGTVLFEGHGKINFQTRPGTTWLSSARLTFTLRNFPLTEWGRYWFHVRVGDCEARHPLDVVEGTPGS